MQESFSIAVKLGSLRRRMAARLSEYSAQNPIIEADLSEFSSNLPSFHAYW